MGLTLQFPTDYDEQLPGMGPDNYRDPAELNMPQ